MGFYEDLASQMISIYPGKNDVPRAATAGRGGNASDLVRRFNNLIIYMRDKIAEIDSSITILSTTIQQNLDIAKQLIDAQFDYSRSAIRESSLRIDELENGLNALEIGSDLNTRVLTSNTTWYVDSTNGSDENDGLTISTALQSIAKASRLASSYTNPRNFGRVIDLMPGIHNGADLAGYLPSSTFDKIVRSSHDPDELAVIQGANPIHHSSPGIYVINSVIFKQSYNTNAYIVANNAKLMIGNIKFEEDSDGEVCRCHILVTNKAEVEVISEYSIAASAYEAHVILDLLSTLSVSQGLIMEDIPITINKNVSFDEAFVVASKYSYLLTNGVRFEVLPGFAVTGKRFAATKSSVIDTTTGNVNNLPGSLPGTTETNSYYY